MLRMLTTNVTNKTTTAGEIETKVSMPWYNLLAVIVLVMLSAYCNGTNIGVMGLDVQQLEVMSKGPF